MTTLPVYSVSFTVTTSDEDTLDIMLDTLEAFAPDVREILSSHDPLATVLLTSSDGLTIKC
jgi:hypothetical protein